MKKFTCISLLCAISLLFLMACSGTDGLHPDEVVISGKFKNSKGEMLRLICMTVDSSSVVDSVKVDEEGCFEMRVVVDKPAFYTLGTGVNNFINLLLENGEDVVIEGSLMALANDYSVSGSKGSVLMWELNEHTRLNYRRSDSLFRILDAGQSSKRYDSIKQRVDSSYYDIFKEQQSWVKDFIRKNSSSLATLPALYQVFGRTAVVNEQEDFELYELLDKSLSEKYPESQYVAELSARVEVVRQDAAAAEAREQLLDSGQVAPEIVLKTMAGYPVKLSSLKGHVVLVYFWASWSLPSQQPIPYYQYLYKKYGPRGFTIYGVSLDKDRQGWEDAVREHQMTWIQVSDLMEWKSPLVRMYNVTSIPMGFLIGSDGKIICKRPDQQQLTEQLLDIYRF